jgi:hypothetical protein
VALVVVPLQQNYHKLDTPVLVIEKGKYYHQSEIVQTEEKLIGNMYDGGTAVDSTNRSISVLSGNTTGGGTTLNYLALLKVCGSILLFGIKML